jgi:hypothetical protein
VPAARAPEFKRYAQRRTKVKPLFIACFLSLLLIGQSAVAGDYCPPMPKPQKEGGPWYIPESAFTKEEANRALKELQSQINTEWNGADFINVENRLKMIKGYLFRLYLDGYRKQFGQDDKALKEEFCRFMREQAFISH